MKARSGDRHTYTHQNHTHNHPNIHTHKHTHKHTHTHTESHCKQMTRQQVGTWPPSMALHSLYWLKLLTWGPDTCFCDVYFHVTFSTYSVCKVPVWRFDSVKTYEVSTQSWVRHVRRIGVDNKGDRH